MKVELAPHLAFFWSESGCEWGVIANYGSNQRERPPSIIYLGHLDPECMKYGRPAADIIYDAQPEAESVDFMTRGKESLPVCHSCKKTIPDDIFTRFLLLKWLLT